MGLGIKVLYQDWEFFITQTVRRGAQKSQQEHTLRSGKAAEFQQCLHLTYGPLSPEIMKVSIRWPWLIQFHQLLCECVCRDISVCHLPKRNTMHFSCAFRYRTVFLSLNKHQWPPSKTWRNQPRDSKRVYFTTSLCLHNWRITADWRKAVTSQGIQESGPCRESHGLGTQKSAKHPKWTIHKYGTLALCNFTFFDHAVFPTRLRELFHYTENIGSILTILLACPWCR